MPPESLTAELVVQTLRALARGEHAPALLPNTLDLREIASPAERTRHIRRYLARLIAARLNDLRVRTRPVVSPSPPTWGGQGIEETSASSPPDVEAATRIEVAAALAFDFACANPNLEAWSALFHRYFCNAELSVATLAAAAHVSERQFRRRVEAGVELLTEQLRRDEAAARGRLRRLRLDRYLPPPDYLHLFGVQEHIAAAASLLADPAGPAVIALEGMGGIGKTTLAQAVAHRLAEQGPFAAILWVTAQQNRFRPATGDIEALPEPALTFTELLLQLIRQLGQDDLLAQGPDEWEQRLMALFHAAPYLIVVDNLETLADHRALAPRLHRMLGVSRALITSRQSLSEHAFVRALPVPPLSPTDSLALVRCELIRVGRRAGADAGLAEICTLAGGLPLALKLIAGLLNGGAPLSQIRDDLKRAGGATRALYTYIYRQTWRLLPETTRRLLVDMLLISPDGEDLEWIAATGSLSAEELHVALPQLLNHCLLQITGSLERPFYRLHPLTAIFLRSDLIAGWEAEPTP